MSLSEQVSSALYNMWGRRAERLGAHSFPSEQRANHQGLDRETGGGGGGERWSLEKRSPLSKALTELELGLPHAVYYPTPHNPLPIPNLTVLWNAAAMILAATE